MHYLSSKAFLIPFVSIVAAGLWFSLGDQSQTQAATCTTTISQGQSVQSAIDNANPGDVICLRQGIYKESIVWHRSGTSGAPITVQSSPGERATLELYQSTPHEGVGDCAFCSNMLIN